MMKIRLLERRLDENANYMQTENYTSADLHMAFVSAIMN